MLQSLDGGAVRNSILFNQGVYGLLCENIPPDIPLKINVTLPCYIC